MLTIYHFIYYFMIIFHILTLLYYAVVTIVSVAGILNRYPRLNRINFYIIAVIISLQMIYSFGCPLTEWQNFAAEKIGAPPIYSFVTELFLKFGLRVEPQSVLITFVILNAAIILSHFYYKYRPSGKRTKKRKSATKKQ